MSGNGAVIVHKIAQTTETTRNNRETGYTDNQTKPKNAEACPMEPGQGGHRWRPLLPASAFALAAASCCSCTASAAVKLVRLRAAGIRPSLRDES